MCPVACNLPSAVSGPAKHAQQKQQAPTVAITHPDAIQFAAPSALQLTIEPQLVLERNPFRTALIIQNDSPVAWRAGFGWQPSRSYGFLILPGSRKAFVGWHVPLEAVYLMADITTDTAAARVYSGVLIEGTPGGQ